MTARPFREGEQFSVHGDPNVYEARRVTTTLPAGYVIRSADEIREAAALICERMAQDDERAAHALHGAARRIRRLGLSGMRHRDGR